MRTVLSRLAGTVTLTCAIVAGTAGVASAHVRVTPSTTAAGAYSQLTFRVPNERDRASTTTVSVTLPQTDPFLAVSVRPVPGWTVTTAQAPLPRPVTEEGTTITRAVRTVTWTASAGAAIGPDRFQEFSIVVGKLPGAGRTVALPTDQTYSNGEVVRWDQPTTGGKEPERPSPALTVTAAESDGTEPAREVATTGSTTGSTTDSTARWIGGGGLLAGVVGIGAGVAGRRRPREGGRS
ncbi:YcnI family protein [Luteipulveratus sp. YIM 133132]|uniref:YcnI family copper-binding membrane protein n=1 Tax=Luteipulveratus flavus TaxID=3031728 RepID=UPI0023B11270|nr:YcnI family protein [Luteipulveratus sp. YIM 133132]MDE9366724.1 YcnI family protein [Luteipulveratus sp. YIM 133132]